MKIGFIGLGRMGKNMVLNLLDKKYSVVVYNRHSEKVKEISELSIDFSPERKRLEEMFESMKDIAEHTDKSFIGAVLAQEKKQLNGLDKLEKRLLRAQKRKYADRVERIKAIQDHLFPKGSLQERQANFSEFYAELGKDLIPLILARLDPFKMEFDLIKI
jgi:6-phosphogluconate dehydrogenase (decarboxylating)